MSDRDKLKLDCGNQLSGVECFWMRDENDTEDSPGICYRCYVQRDSETHKEIEKALGSTADEYLVSLGQVPSYIEAAKVDVRRAALEEAVGHADRLYGAGCTPATIVESLRNLLDEATRT